MGGSFPRLDNASVFSLLSAMDFPFTASAAGGRRHRLAHRCPSIQLPRRLSQISSGAARVAIRLLQTRCSFQTVRFPLAPGCLVIHARCMLVHTGPSPANIDVINIRILTNLELIGTVKLVFFSVCDYMLSSIRFWEGFFFFFAPFFLNFTVQQQNFS